jgi:hypothetical protein
MVKMPSNSFICTNKLHPQYWTPVLQFRSEHIFADILWNFIQLTVADAQLNILL